MSWLSENATARKNVGVEPNISTTSEWKRTTYKNLSWKSIHSWRRCLLCGFAHTDLLATQTDFFSQGFFKRETLNLEVKKKKGKLWFLEICCHSKYLTEAECGGDTQFHPQELLLGSSGLESGLSLTFRSRGNRSLSSSAVKKRISQTFCALT